MAYTLIFLLETMWVAFAFGKSYSHFFSKNTCKLDVVHVLIRTVNILTTNELVNLTMLWTTGPRCLRVLLQLIVYHGYSVLHVPKK